MTHHDWRLPDDVRAKDPSVRLTYMAIRSNTPTTADHIQQRTGLRPDSIYAALETLRELDHVRTIADPEDGRRHLHYLDDNTENVPT